VAQQGRTVLFVSHNMSAILRLTDETIVLDHGKLVYRAPSPEAVDYYLSTGLAQSGERYWLADEIPESAAPFRPIALRIRNAERRVVDTIRSVDPFTLEFEYVLDQSITGVRVGVYLMSGQGEVIFTAFDTDEPELYERYSVRPEGHYLSRCLIPPDLLNEGRYVVGINASTFRIRRYFQDEYALAFSVDPSGAPGMQWPETRLGPLRPRLVWQIENQRA
ncbi:MAG: hypothetical protein MUO64_21185, partial [Anaerolineales bacterium]|nr:hypothetical protein [Anaerolineales bacterium]